MSYGLLVFIFYPKGNINSSIISFQTNNSLFFSGFDIQNLFTLLEKIHLMSNPNLFNCFNHRCGNTTDNFKISGFLRLCEAILSFDGCTLIFNCYL